MQRYNHLFAALSFVYVDICTCTCKSTTHTKYEALNVRFAVHTLADSVIPRKERPLR